MRAKAPLAIDYSAHEFVRMECALHQSLDLASPRHRHGLRSRRLAVLRGHYLAGAEVELGGFGRRADLVFRPDQDRDDQLLAPGLDGTDE